MTSSSSSCNESPRIVQALKVGAYVCWGVCVSAYIAQLLIVTSTPTSPLGPAWLYYPAIALQCGTFMIFAYGPLISLIGLQMTDSDSNESSDSNVDIITTTTATTTGEAAGTTRTSLPKACLYALIRLALFLSALFPFLIHMSPSFVDHHLLLLVYIMAYVDFLGFFCISRQFDTDSYALLLCLLAALVSTSFKGFHPKHHDPLPCKVVVFSSSLVLVFLYALSSSLNPHCCCVHPAASAATTPPPHQLNRVDAPMNIV